MWIFVRREVVAMTQKFLFLSNLLSLFLSAGCGSASQENVGGNNGSGNRGSGDLSVVDGTTDLSLGH